jgi:hypothetical protein
MSKRYDICTPRKGRDDKTFWTRIGTAWENDRGIQLVFDALPIPDSEGRCVANLFEPRDSQGQRQPSNGDWKNEVRRNFPDASDYSDDAPF